MNTKRIERYIDNDMTLEEKEKFETDLKSDSKLSDDFRLHTSMNKFFSDPENTVIDPEKDALKQTIKQVQKEYRKTESRIKKLYRRRMATAAAAAVILLISGIWMWTSMETGSNAELYAQYAADDYSGAGLQRGDNKAVDAAAAAYRTGNYAKAVSIYEKEKILESKKRNKPELIYLGIAYTKTDKHVKAEECFNTVLSDETSTYKEAARWYLSLLYLKTGETEKAKHLWEFIKKQDIHFKKKSAEELLIKFS